MIVLIISIVLDALGPSTGADRDARLGSIGRALASWETQSVIALQE